MHRFIPDPSASTTPVIDPSHSAAIKRWTAEILRLPADAIVTVAEIPCLDAGCPLVETTVTVFENASTRAWKLTRPRIAVTKLMLRQTLATPPATQTQV